MPFRNLNDEPAIAQIIRASLGRPGSLELTPVAPADYYRKFSDEPREQPERLWDIAPVSWSPDWVGGAARSAFQPQFTSTAGTRPTTTPTTTTR